jgi:predicted MFS family arabinose efflux permease
MQLASDRPGGGRYQRHMESGTHATRIIIAAAAILSICMGLRQCMGLFLPPIRADIGLSASEFGLAMAIQNLVWGLGQPFIGMLGDRYGARPVLIASAIAYAVGLLMMSWSHSAFGFDFGGGVVAGLGVAGTGFGVLVGTVSKAVSPERRSQTVGLVSAGGSLGTLILAPFGQAVITNFGWRNALLAFVLIAAAMALIAIAMGGNRTESSQVSKAPPTGSTAEILRHAVSHRGYLAMSAAFFACGFQLMFITAYLPQYLAICGISPGTSATALGLIGLGNAVGSYIFGRLGGKFSPKRLLSLDDRADPGGVVFQAEPA